MSDTGQVRAGRVLLAEDDRVSQAVAAAMLTTLGFDLVIVSDGAEAVKAATQSHFHLILLDCQLPVLDGYQAAMEIRRLQAGSRRTPIVAVTSTPVRAGQERSLTAGMDDYLAKPYSLKALAAVLARWAPDRSLRTDVLDDPKPRRTAVAGATESKDANASRPVLDSTIVDRLQRLGDAAGEDLRSQLADLFLADARRRVAILQQALTENDAMTASKTAHMLSGASANIGAVGLARLCAAFSSDCAADSTMPGQERLDAVEAELERVRPALRTPARAP
jgi:CheY-like chemotaxis protein